MSNNSSGWKVITNKKRQKKKSPKNVVVDDDFENIVNDINNNNSKVDGRVNTQVNIQVNIQVNTQENDQVDNHQTNDQVDNNQDNGDSLLLNYEYDLWIHDITSKDWSINGYKKLCAIKTVSHFWKLFNNLTKLGIKFNNLFLMRSGTDPTWEHVNNRNGGVCSFKIELDRSLPVFEDLCIHMVCGKLNHEDNDINGISISPRNTWALIKIWNKNKKNDLTLTLNKDIMIKYHDLSIKYKTNEPEY